MPCLVVEFQHLVSTVASALKNLILTTRTGGGFQDSDIHSPPVFDTKVNRKQHTFFQYQLNMFVEAGTTYHHFSSDASALPNRILTTRPGGRFQDSDIHSPPVFDTKENSKHHTFFQYQLNQIFVEIAKTYHHVSSVASALPNNLHHCEILRGCDWLVVQTLPQTSHRRKDDEMLETFWNVCNGYGTARILVRLSFVAPIQDGEGLTPLCP